MVKRIIEIVFALIFLILFSPIMCLIALAVRIDTRGPVIFKQERVGFRGKRFTLYKFRTMFCNTDPMALSPRGLQDKRITRVGRLLRKYAVDEWPQLYNILRGDMSFVGPRPQLSKELEKFQDDYPDLLEKRLTVRPGLTCLWAITSGKIKIEPTLEMLVEDCRYVDTASLRQDVKIFFQTFIYLLNRR
jgi:lipopolysaccharide/colanic/teichoic acid biosynthesis glycosyltransferase